MAGQSASSALRIVNPGGAYDVSATDSTVTQGRSDRT